MQTLADRFFNAVRTLTGEGTTKERLVRAFVENLEGLRTDELPEAIQPRFELMRQAMTAVPATERETSVQVSVRKMSPSDATRYTRSILAMFAELVRVKDSGERLGAVDVKSVTGKHPKLKSGPRPPTFLSRA